MESAKWQNSNVWKKMDPRKKMIINCKEIRDKEIAKIKETYKGGCKVAFIQVGENEESNVELTEGQVYSKTLEDAGDDPSTHNQSSVIIKFTPSNGKTYLFTGDAGREAMTHIMQRDVNKIKNINWLKVPHHGSIYNLDSDLLDEEIRKNTGYIKQNEIVIYTDVFNQE